MYLYKMWMHWKIFLVIIKSYRMHYCPTLKMGQLYSSGPPQKILPFKSTVPCSVVANSLCLRNWRVAILRRFWREPARIFLLTFSGRMKKSRKMMSMSIHFISFSCANHHFDTDQSTVPTKFNLTKRKLRSNLLFQLEFLSLSLYIKVSCIAHTCV